MQVDGVGAPLVKITAEQRMDGEEGVMDSLRAEGLVKTAEQTDLFVDGEEGCIAVGVHVVVVPSGVGVRFAGLHGHIVKAAPPDSKGTPYWDVLLEGGEVREFNVHRLRVWRPPG